VTEVNFNKLRFLVADDFSNFRGTVNGMLGKMGVFHVDMASNGADVLEKCQRKAYDVILCDYNLGSGKNGQQVLEELRFRQLISHKTLFMLISAEATKDVVMAAYDCVPDDYLMKPINTGVLQQRLVRLLAQRLALSHVYNALYNGDHKRAMGLLIEISVSGGRHARFAQKLLGELFIKEGELSKAEKLYTKVMEERPVDWARLGLAQVRHLKGDLDLAGEWLQKIVNDNPLYLPAYDILASNWEKRGQLDQVQEVIQQSVLVSPKSILRQKRLAQVAENNGDLMTALSASRSVIRLGNLSCHATPEDGLGFARLACLSLEKKLPVESSIIDDALSVISETKTRFELTKDQIVSADLVIARAYANEGDLDLARPHWESAEEFMDKSSDASLEVNIDRIRALIALGNKEAADQLLHELLQFYSYDQAALEKLDALLAEPVSEANRALISSVNREGIDLYNQGRFDEAIECFEKVQRMFTRHIGIQLNIVQSLIGKIREGSDEEKSTEMLKAFLKDISAVIDPDHSQYSRFLRLKNMAKI
jgi:tetratricopeptide (TPR) repeat protein